MGAVLNASRPGSLTDAPKEPVEDEAANRTQEQHHQQLFRGQRQPEPERRHRQGGRQQFDGCAAGADIPGKRPADSGTNAGAATATGKGATGARGGGETSMDGYAAVPAAANADAATRIGTARG